MGHRKGCGRVGGAFARFDLLSKNIVQYLRADRFAEVAIHARGKAAVLIAFHGVGGEGKDNLMIVTTALLFTEEIRCGEPLHFGHLHIHQDEVVAPPREGLERFLAVCGDGDAMASLFQQVQHQALVYQIIFGDQDAEHIGGIPRILRSVAGEEGYGALLLRSTEHARNRFTQLGLTNRFQEIGRDAQLLAAFGVAEAPGRSKQCTCR